MKHIVWYSKPAVAGGFFVFKIKNLCVQPEEKNGYSILLRGNIAGVCILSTAEKPLHVFATGQLYCKKGIIVLL